MNSPRVVPVHAFPRVFPRFQATHIWILNRYLIAELLPPLSMGLFLFASALMLISIRDILDIILLSGAPFLPIFRTLICIFPVVLMESLPIGCLLAALLVYGRLGEDREITAMRAAGVGTLPIIMPALVLGAFLAVFNFYWTTAVIPRSEAIMSSQKWEIVQQMTSVSWLKPGQFTQLQEDLAFYFTGATPGSNTIHDITIFKSSNAATNPWLGDTSTNEEASNWTVSAPTATLVPNPTRGVLMVGLKNCISEDLKPEKLSRVKIENATITVDIGKRLLKLMKFSKQQKTWDEIWEEIDKWRLRYEDLRAHLGFEEGTPHRQVLDKVKEYLELEQKQPNSSPLAGGISDLLSVKLALGYVQVYTNQAMIRVAYPAATFLFMMLGAGLGMLTGRGNRTVCLVITIGILVFYYSVQKVAEGYTENYALNYGFDPGFAVWAPNVILFLFGLFILRLVSKI
jgi:lipopolysaccharide export LptBFGC system permease protein LptF